MSIAQFDPTNVKSVAAPFGAANTNGTANGDFARLLQDAQAQAALETQRHQAQRQAKAASAGNQPAETHPAAQTKPDKTKAAQTTRDGTTDKTHDPHHAARKAADSTDAQPTVQPPQPQPQTPPAPAAAASPPPAASTNTTPTNTSSTDAGSADTTASADAAAATAAAPVQTAATGQPAAASAAPATTPAEVAAAAAAQSEAPAVPGGQPAAATPSTTATSAAATATAPATGTAAGQATTAALAATTAIGPSSLATLTALGIGRGASAGASGNGTAAAGKTAAPTVAISIAKAPATVRPSLLTTALPQEVDATAVPAGQSAAANAAAAQGSTTTDGGGDPAGDPASPLPAPEPAGTGSSDLATAFAATAATAAATEQLPVATTAPGQHGSLFAQGGDTATSTAGLTGGTAPAAPGFATVNAGTTVSRAETAETPQGGQGNQAPLQLPAEQLAVAISRNAGADGGQNFTIRLTPEKLGSVEVKMQVDAKGKTTANFVVEHPETLHLLKQDSQQLVQALQNAGVDTNGASLSFSLRDSNMGQAQNQASGSAGGQNGGTAAATDGTEAAEEQPTIASNRLYDIKA